MFKKIPVPLDGSELDDGILPFVSQLATALGSSVILMSVLDKNGNPPAESLRDSRRETAKKLASHRLRVDSLLAYGDPAEEILRAVEEQGCDLSRYPPTGGVDLQGELGAA